MNKLGYYQGYMEKSSEASPVNELGGHYISPSKEVEGYSETYLKGPEEVSMKDYLQGDEARAKALMIKLRELGLRDKLRVSTSQGEWYYNDKVPRKLRKERVTHERIKI